MSKETLGIENLLLEAGVINKAQLSMAKAHLRVAPHLQLSDVLINLRLAKEVDILNVLASAFNIDAKEVQEDMRVEDVESIKNFSYNLAKNTSDARGHVVASVDLDNSTVVVAMNNIMDSTSIRKTRSYFQRNGYECRFVLTTKINLYFLQKQVYEELDNFVDSLEGLMLSDDASENLEEILSLIIEWAALEKASDVFFFYNAQAEFSYVYMKISGQKVFSSVIPESVAEKLASFIETKSGMQPGKIMGHQDGTMVIPILKKTFNITSRLNKLNTDTGAQYTFRIQQEDVPRLESLGFEPDDIDDIRRVINMKKGIVVLTGATGSGKTTTLYSMLDNYDPDTKNIITMEDPVEMPRRGWNQVPIFEESGQGFSESIRAILRQAPDIVLFGEIRDKETAQRAVEMSLTGHLVFCTLHTNNIDPGIGARLKDLGVENPAPFIDQIKLAIYQELRPGLEKGLELGYFITKGSIKNIKGVRIE